MTRRFFALIISAFYDCRPTCTQYATVNRMHLRPPRTRRGHGRLIYTLRNGVPLKAVLLKIALLAAVLLSLSACSINPSKLSPYEQTQLACTLQVGQQPDSQISIAGYKLFSFGFSAPAESEQEEEYDRRRMEHQECMRARGF